MSQFRGSLKKEGKEMFPDVYSVINQQFQMGCASAQQAMTWEASGNVMGAAQLYDQAIAVVANSVGQAAQYGVLVPDHVHFTLAVIHYNAARVKIAMGWQAPALAHLNASLLCLNQAIGMNPNMFQYHNAAGNVLLMLGNLPEAERAFYQAISINPMDQSSRWMLNFVQAAQGRGPGPGGYDEQAQQATPGLPPVMQAMEQVGMSFPSQGGQQPQRSEDWMSKLNNVLGLVDKAATTGNNVMDFFQKFGQW
jgi:tetratricopeptide (TPR) repeat protein